MIEFSFLGVTIFHKLYHSIWQLYLSLSTCILQTDLELHHNDLHQNRHHEDAKLTEELDKDGVHCAQDNRKRQRIKALHDNHSTDTVSCQNNCRICFSE